MATYPEREGFQLLGDDLCAIRFGGDRRPASYPGIPRLKLWVETLTLFERDASGLERVASDLPKYHVPWTTSARQARLRPCRSSASICSTAPNRTAIC